MRRESHGGVKRGRVLNTVYQRKKKGVGRAASGRDSDVTVRGSGQELKENRSRMGKVLGSREQKK